MSDQVHGTTGFPAADCLLVFIDDTGDPAYCDPINPIFGLGRRAMSMSTALPATFISVEHLLPRLPTSCSSAA